MDRTGPIPPQTPFAAQTSINNVIISGLLRAPYIIEGSGFGYKSEFFQAIIVGNAITQGRLTWILERSLRVFRCMGTLTIRGHQAEAVPAFQTTVAVVPQSCRAC